MGVKVDLLLISLLIGTCLSNSVYSVIAPFYPQVALKNGLSDGLIGIVFSSYPIAATVVSPIYTYMLLNIGRKKVLVFASIQLILSQIGFMMAPSLKGNTLFVVSLISRAVQGTGSVGITAGSYAVIANNYKDNLTTLMAVMQSMTGLGALIGPLLGTVLFYLGGFEIIFMIYSGILVLYTIAIIIKVPQDQVCSSEEAKISVMDVLNNKIVILICINVLVSLIDLSALEPVLSTHLARYEVPDTLCGVFFTIPTVTYIIGVVILNQLPEKVNRLICNILALFILAVGIILMGPWTTLYLPQNLGVISLGLVILGLGLSWSNSPALPLMIDHASETLRGRDSQQISDAASGLLASCVYFGEVIGPLYSGFATELIGFEQMAGWLGLSNLVYGIIFAVLCGNFMAMMRCKKPHYMGLLEQELVKYEDNDLNSSTLTASSNDKIESP